MDKTHIYIFFNIILSVISGKYEDYYSFFKPYMAHYIIFCI